MFLLYMFCDFDGCHEDWLESDDIGDTSGSVNKIEDFAASSGWLKMPNGTWLCDKHAEWFHTLNRIEEYLPEFREDATAAIGKLTPTPQKTDHSSTE